MTDRWSKLAPLTGVLFGIIVVVAIVTGGGETPDANARPARVIAYYGTHRSEVETSAILFALAFLVLLLFAGVLRSYLRRTPAAEGLGSLALAGAVLIAAGALIGTGVEYGLAHQLQHLGPEVAQTLNFLDNELFLPVLAGAFVFGISSGLAILRGAALPKVAGMGRNRARGYRADPTHGLLRPAGIRDLDDHRVNPGVSAHGLDHRHAGRRLIAGAV